MLNIKLKIHNNFDYRLKAGTWLVIISVAVIYLLNSLLPMINLQADLWEYPALLPFIHPVGRDFREGLFYPAKVLLQGKSPYTDYTQNYPPFTNVIAIPFRLFNVQTAYVIQVILLYVLNLVTIFIAVKVVELIFPEFFSKNPIAAGLISNTLFLTLSFYTVTSYGFIFSVERGNYDIYTMFFSMLGLWVLIKRPEQLWLQVILFSIATHLKIYPAILFSLVIWRHRWKSLFPIIAVNLILLLITGFTNAILYIKILLNYMSHPNIYIGNQSGTAFGTLLNRSLTNHFGIILPTWLFTIVPVIIWTIGFVILYRRKYNPLHAVILFILSVPVMNLIPSTSYDYKLVLFSAPLFVLLFLLLQNYIDQGKLFDRGRLIVLMVVMFMMARSPAFINGLIASKYPIILLMQLVILSIIIFPIHQLISNNEPAQK